jgi:WS/DGAT/MGAT family acyltransferase
VDRPTALDLAFLDLETPQAPLHVGWTLRFGPGPAGAADAPSLAALRRHLDARLHAVPRFRRRLVAPAPLGLGGPSWVDDPGFDVARHAFAVSLPAPGGAEQLREIAGLLLSQPLPADRPLWRMYLLDGLDGGGFALVGQAHHALVDGIAAIEVALLLFGPAARSGDGRAPEAWAPGAAPAPGAALRAAMETRARAAAGATRDAAEAIVGEAAATAESAGARAARGVASALRGATRAVDALARTHPTTSLERSATARRAVAYAEVPLDAVRDAGRRRGATVNDVLLAATGVALRSALRRRGDRREGVRALVPVNVRGAGGPDALGNRISFLPVELPVGEPDADRALALVRSRTVDAKAGGDAGALEALGRAADALPGPGRKLVARTALRAVPFTLVVSNVPGPPVELALLGRPLRAIHPMVPLLHGHALTIGAVSYDGRLHVGLAADAEVVPDVVEIARDLEAAFDALRVGDGGGATSGGGPRGVTPWGDRARARRQRAANR